MLAFDYKILLLGLFFTEILPGQANPEEKKKDEGGLFSYAGALTRKVSEIKDMGTEFAGQKLEGAITASMDTMPENMQEMRPYILTSLKTILPVVFPVAAPFLMPTLEKMIKKYSSDKEVSEIEKNTRKSQKPLDTTDILLYKLMAENIDDEGKLREFMDLGMDSVTVKKATNSFLTSLKKIVDAHVQNYITRMEDTTEAILEKISGQRKTVE